MFVIRVENPCNSCVTLCANLERIGQRGQILFGVLKKGKSYVVEDKSPGRARKAGVVRDHQGRSLFR